MSTEIWKLFLFFILTLGISLPLLTLYVVVTLTQGDKTSHPKFPGQSANGHQNLEQSLPLKRSILIINGESPQGCDPDESVRNKRNFIRTMTLEAWTAYTLYAWGSNELKPVSLMGDSQEIFGPGATIVDALDTLYIMGLTEEYDAGRLWIRDNLNFSEYENYVSVFEMNIRFLGGLLSLFTLTGNDIFLHKAILLSERLSTAFNQSRQFPSPLLNLKTGDLRHHHWLESDIFLLSELGTFRLEFEYLSDITGDRRFYEWALKLQEQLIPNTNGLYNNYVYSANKSTMSLFSVGGFGDSFYENLLKSGIMFGDENSITYYQKAIDALESNDMFKRSSPGELLYITEITGNGEKHRMEHLSCFVGAMLALGTNYDSSSQHYKTRTSPRKQRDLYLAEKITETCRKSYDQSETGLGPEIMRFKLDKKRGLKLEARGQYKEDFPYKLRPEYVESLFILWRTTGNPKYRLWAWDVAVAIKTHCQSKENGGFSGLSNVYVVDNSTNNLDDKQQSYFLAETLKYLYLIFSSDSLIDLDFWVFNTEGHPLPIRNSNPFYKVVGTKYTKI